jgi:type IV pilus assembly protein PilA
MKTRGGFTLIELMVVVTVIAIIGAIALPALLRSRLQTNETAAIQNLRTVLSAQTGFHTTNSRFGTIAELKSEQSGAGTSYLDQTWQDGGNRQGYAFVMEQADVGDFLCYADPVERGITGIRYFRIDTSGVIRWNRDGRPSDTDPELNTQS